MPSAISNGHGNATARPPAGPGRTGDQAAAIRASRRRGRRRVGILMLVAALVTGIASATAWLISEPALSGVPAVPTQSTAPAVPTATPSSVGPSPASESASPSPESPSPAASNTPDVRATTGTGSAAGPIELERPGSAEPFQTVRIQGMYRGGSDSLLRVQREEDGKWLSFPLPFITDGSGRFTTYVELGNPGRYRIRVLDPATGVKSKSVMLTVKGY